MGMGTDQDDRSRTGRAAMAGQGRGDAHGDVSGRAGRSRAREAETKPREQIERETTGRKAPQADMSATGTRTKRAPRRPANAARSGAARRGDALRTRGGRRVAQADLCG